ncbi:MAG: 6-phosphogluconolactonase [Rhodobacteraceae bacterium]|nr:6-phosphogluconolactonase [Paracoccaceae bacterium]
MAGDRKLMPDFMQYPDRDILAVDLAEVVADQLNEAIAARGKASIAVPGGTTPKAFLQALSEQEVKWKKVSVLLTDERFVEETSLRSNTRLLKETLLQGKAAGATLVPMVAEGGAPETVLEALMAGLSPALPLDVVVLGMGEDMHTASLFPGADRLDEALAEGAPPLMAMRAEGAEEPRLTLTAPVLRGAKSVYILIVGAPKLAALKEALFEGPEAEAPIRVVLARDDTEIHYAE